MGVSNLPRIYLWPLSRLTVHYCLPGSYVASEICFVYCVFFEKVQFKKFLEKLIPRKPFASNDLTAIWRLVSKKKNHEISWERKRKENIAHNKQKKTKMVWFWKRLCVLCCVMLCYLFCLLDLCECCWKIVFYLIVLLIQ